MKKCLLPTEDLMLKFHQHLHHSKNKYHYKMNKTPQMTFHNFVCCRLFFVQSLVSADYNISHCIQQHAIGSQTVQPVQCTLMYSLTANGAILLADVPIGWTGTASIGTGKVVRIRYVYPYFCAIKQPLFIFSLGTLTPYHCFYQ